MSNPVRPLKQTLQFLCTVALPVVQKKTHFTIELFLQDPSINQHCFVAQTVEQDFSIVKVMGFESQGMNKLTN